MMDATNPTNTTSSVRGVMFYITASFAVLTCPCHLPILILLFSGTAAGSLVHPNLQREVGLLDFGHTTELIDAGYHRTLEYFARQSNILNRHA